MRRLPILVPSLLAAAMMVAVAGCSNDDTDVSAMAGPDETTTDASDNVAPGATNVPGDNGLGGDQMGTNLTVATAEGIDGSFLADSAGTSLYFLEGDTDGSMCVDECTETWPPYLVEGAMPADTPGLDPVMVGVVTRADGSTQVSYDGHPLYRYSGDSGAGSTAGHGVEDQWGHWYLITPDGEEAGEAAGATDQSAEAATTGY